MIGSLNACIACNMYGTMQVDTNLGNLQPAPPPGGAGRHLWPKHSNCQGPIGLLARCVHLVGAVLAEGFVIRQHNEKEIRMHWQFLGRAVSDLCCRARMRATLDRSSFEGLSELDITVLRSLESKLPWEDARIFRHLASGAAWDQASKLDAGQSTDDKGSRCHQPM